MELPVQTPRLLPHGCCEHETNGSVQILMERNFPDINQQQPGQEKGETTEEGKQHSKLHSKPQRNEADGTQTGKGRGKTKEVLTTAAPGWELPAWLPQG